MNRQSYERLVGLISFGSRTRAETATYGCWGAVSTVETRLRAPWLLVLLVLGSAAIMVPAATQRVVPSTHAVPFYPSAEDAVRQGFARVINHSAEAGTVEINAFDDEGQRFGPISLSIDAGEVVHFNSVDLEQGNAAKGLATGTGDGQGDWRLALSSELDIEVLAYIRTDDGFLTAIHDTVAEVDGKYWVPTFNPGSNNEQVSLLRLSNPGDKPAEVSIKGVDGNGASPGTMVEFTIPAFASRTYSAAELESGSAEGLDGSLGDGSGKWQLFVDADEPVIALSLLSSPTGHLTNLSTAPDDEENGTYVVPLFPSVANPNDRQGFVRVINRSDASGEVMIDAFDDSTWEYEPLTLALSANETVHFNSDDLELGNRAKGLTGSTGPGQGDWRLELSSELDIAVLAYIRTTDGFLTAMHDRVPYSADRHRIVIFNPASNVDQKSLLRLVNVGDEDATIDIRGTDDLGASPGGDVRVAVKSGASRLLTAAQLESGDGVEGALGDGTGKWRLSVEAGQPLVVMNLLSSPTGHLTNLSTAPGRALETASDVFGTRVSPIVQDKCVNCHVEGGAASETRLVFVKDTDDDHLDKNLGSFRNFLAAAENGAALILDKIQGGADHGGGTQVEADTAEFGDMERFLELLGDAGPLEPEVFVYRLVGENDASRAGHSVAAAGDTNGDGLGDLIVGSPSALDGELGAAYLLSGADLEAADAADGLTDRVVELGDVAVQEHSMTVVGEGWYDYVGSEVAPAGDQSGDGLGDVWVGARGRDNYTGEVYLVTQAGLENDGEDRVPLGLAEVAARPGAWTLGGEEQYDNAGRAVANADVDGDGQPDVLVGVPYHDGGDGSVEDGGTVYVLADTALSAADAADGEVDRRIDLGNVAAADDSWKLVTEGSGDRFGFRVAGGDIDADGRDDILVSAPGPWDAADADRRSAVYVVAATALDTADAADGERDGVVRMTHVVDGSTSWKLVGEPGTRWEGVNLSAGDVTGDGRPEVLIGSSDVGKAYVVSIADLPRADDEDGAADGIVELAHVARQPSSYLLTGDIGSFRLASASIASSDFDGDAINDVIVGAPFWSGGADFRPSSTEIYTPGAVYLVSGTDLAGAADTEGRIDLEQVAGLPKSWKIVGESGAASDRLGSTVGSAGDMTGDGIDELYFGAPTQLLPYFDGGSSVGPGGVVLLSGADLANADAKDGTADATVHLNSLNISHVGPGRPAPSIAMVHDDHVVVMDVPRTHTDRFDYLAQVFLSHYDDVFDYLMFVSNHALAEDTPYRYAGTFVHVGPGDGGTGIRQYDSMQDNRLRGFIHFSYRDGAIAYSAAHEIMHTWGNFVIDAGHRPHWGFSSANGQLGGFDADDLKDLGEGRYSAGRFSPHSNDVPYSPLELYLAGWAPPEDVPDVSVALDARWNGETDDDGNRVFTASAIEKWSIERIVEEKGMRDPPYADAQKTFRAAVILMVDEERPATEEVLAELAAEIRRFAHADSDEHDDINFWEATGGRATIEMGALSSVRKDAPTAMRWPPARPNAGRYGIREPVIDCSGPEMRAWRRQTTPCGIERSSGLDSSNMGNRHEHPTFPELVDELGALEHGDG